VDNGSTDGNGRSCETEYSRGVVSCGFAEIADPSSYNAGIEAARTLNATHIHSFS
jgi:hypothetical protein